MPADDMLVVKFASLAQASADIQAALNSMQQGLQDLEQSAAPLVQSWNGEARNAYDARQRKWRQGADDLHQILTDIKNALDHSAQEYERTERQNTALFG